MLGRTQRLDLLSNEFLGPTNAVMTRYKELRRMEAAVLHGNESELRWHSDGSNHGFALRPDRII